MGIRKFLMLETDFDFSNKGRLKDLVYANTFCVFDAFWVLVCKFMFYLVGLVIGSIFRIRPDKDLGCDESKTSLVVSEQENTYGSVHGDSEHDGFTVKEREFEGLTDQREDFEGYNKSSDCFDKINGQDKESSVVMENHLVSRSSRYEFLPNNGFSISDFVEEPEAAHFIVHEIYIASDRVEGSAVPEEVLEFPVDEKIEELVVDDKAKGFLVHDKGDDGIERFITEKKFEKSDEFVESFSTEKNLEKAVDSSVKEEMVVYEFLSYTEEREGSDHDNSFEHDCENGENDKISDGKILEMKEAFTSFQNDDSDDEYIDLILSSENPSVVQEEEGEEEEDDELMEEERSNSSSEEEVDNDYSDEELEHDDVVERLKLELKNARTGGLPTILEESESPELLEQLKPLKIDEKIEHKDRMVEIQKVYKSYSDKIRKFDVLNSQTMHSTSLLKLKDLAQSNAKDEESFFRTPKSLHRHNLWRFKKQQPECHPKERLIRDLHRDFETVYVGQICLSWEILHWQYLKTLEFQQHDPQGFFQYNLVAGEFQLFQVLLQRFVENEPFQSCPRVENYLKNRRHFPNFLQVPLIKDDRSRGNKNRNEVEYAITVDQLREIIYESMHKFWEFLRADKNEFNSNLKIPHHTQVSPQEPLDLELLAVIGLDHQKKERRLKDILRSGTCIVKKFQKNETKNNGLKDELLIAQVELRLVSRVLTMSKLTTDQLLWCQEKLNKISFCSRKIHLEPSFSFFPC